MRFSFFIVAAAAIIIFALALPLPGHIGDSTFAITMVAFVIVATAVLFSLRLARPAYRIYMVHRALLETEMCLLEMFARLSPGGVDKRRDRMVEIMTAAETCRNQQARILVSGQENGGTQKTARGIISADQKDLASYRSNRRSARINAFALEAVLRCRPKAARSQILAKQLQALQKASEPPEVIPALGRLLGIPLVATEVQIKALLEEDRSLDGLPIVIGMAARIWRHPGELTFTDKDGRSLQGWDALFEMRKV
jgi:hypothetical protein